MSGVRPRSPSSASPDVINEIFAGSPMITLARIVVLAVGLLIVVACLYAIISIAVRMVRREWLQRAGGFEPELTKPSHNLGKIASVADDLDTELASITPAAPPSEGSSP
ncbi:MAG TPA: hypothetical protein VEW67_09110 [Thermoleophilaceae bacterium]|nr:hypothetical protein [Thermoleophilaceae bacterium]